MDINAVADTVKTTLSDHKSEIYVGFGIGMMLTGTLLGILASPKAEKEIDNIRKSGVTGVDKGKAIVTKVVPHFIWCILCEAGGVICIGNGMKTKCDDVHALETSLGLAEAQIAWNRAYQDAVIEKFGVSGNEQVIQTMNEPPEEKQKNQTQIIAMLDTDDMMAYEPVTGQYMVANYRDLSDSLEEINADMRSGDGTITLNEYVYILNGECGIPHGDYLYLKLDDPSDSFKFRYGSTLNEKGKPCLTIYPDRSPVDKDGRRVEMNW